MVSALEPDVRGTRGGWASCRGKIKAAPPTGAADFWAKKGRLVKAARAGLVEEFAHPLGREIEIQFCAVLEKFGD